MERYFVQSRPDGPEKGPYTVDAIKKSFDNGMLKADAMVRAENGGEQRTLRALLELPEPGAPQRSSFGSSGGGGGHFSQDDLDRQIRHNKSAGQTNIAIGAVMIVAGLGLTAATYSAASGGGRYVVFTGLIIFGFVRLVRGMAGS